MFKSSKILEGIRQLVSTSMPLMTIFAFRNVRINPVIRQTLSLLANACQQSRKTKIKSFSEISESLKTRFHIFMSWLTLEICTCLLLLFEWNLDFAQDPGWSRVVLYLKPVDERDTYIQEEPKTSLRGIQLVGSSSHPNDAIKSEAQTRKEKYNRTMTV